MEGNMKKPLYFDYIKISSIAQLSHKEAFFTELLIWSLYSLTPFLSLLLLCKVCNHCRNEHLSNCLVCTVSLFSAMIWRACLEEVSTTFLHVYMMEVWTFFTFAHCQLFIKYSLLKSFFVDWRASPKVS